MNFSMPAIPCGQTSCQTWGYFIVYFGRRENDMLRQQSSIAEMRGAAASAAPSCSGDEDSGAEPSDELLQRAKQRTGLLSQELAQEISRNEQVPVPPQQPDIAVGAHCNNAWTI